MIERISIADQATFSTTPEVLVDLAHFNFLYGSNGTGKTTISRLIASADQFPTCGLTWRNGIPLQTLVFNRDFVDKHFHQSEDLPGIFTLGKETNETLKQIETAKDDLDVLINSLSTLTTTLSGVDGTGGKKADLATAEELLTGSCWKQKQKHDAIFRDAFEGFRNSSEKFKLKVLHEKQHNTGKGEAFEQLQKKAATVFGEAPTSVPPLPSVDKDAILSLEHAPILKKRVLGKSDVDIAAMIQRLGNSDWVKAGRAFYDASDGTCPFCQQTAPESLSDSLGQYFDAAFENDSQAIDQLRLDYTTESNRIQQRLDDILAITPTFLDTTAFRATRDLFSSTMVINQQHLENKKKEPSRVINLESVKAIVTSATALIDTANQRTTEHNTIVTNLITERRELTANVWRYILDGELKVALSNYDEKKRGLDRAIAALGEKIDHATSQIETKRREIRQLEKTITSTQPTVDAINALLKSFGFSGFSLAKGNNEQSYKLCRPDGSDAMLTLSEGEKSFVTFLYFYHLLKGSDSDSGMTSDRVVVFDDPVSSLDCDVLFVVGSLIKGLFDEVRSGTGHIKQIFVLTHNVYFHKEVTFNPNRKNVAMNEETFWTVRKSGLVSKLVRHDSNPIKTTYELLWTEVRNPDRSTLTIQNTLRRILENYFRILGNVDPDALCAMFEGKEKLICKSLFLWVNDGSHFAHEDVYLTIDNATVDIYLSVFRGVFEKSGHLEHFKMMMGDSFTQSWPEVLSA